MAREILNPGLSRSGLHRMLKRREVPTLARRDAGDDEKPRNKPFKGYKVGYVHIDIRHLHQIPDEKQKRYLCVAIDSATHWVHLEVRCSKSAKDARAFMKRVKEKAHFKVQAVLTDNGKSFTDRFTRAGERKPSGNHLFDQECQILIIKHRLIKPGRSQTIKRYTWLYNHHIPQKALHHKSPITVMKEW